MPRHAQRCTMNIHEYQAKAVLREFGVPVPRGRAAFTVEEAVKAAQRARRPGLGGESADPRRRPRQGRRRQGGESRRRRSVTRPRPTRMLGTHAGHAPDRPAGQAGQPPLYRGRLGHRARALSLDRWSTATPRASPSSPRPKAAWTSRRSRTTRRRRSSPFSVDPATGFMPLSRPPLA